MRAEAGRAPTHRSPGRGWQGAMHPPPPLQCYRGPSAVSLPFPPALQLGPNHLQLMGPEGVEPMVQRHQEAPLLATQSEKEGGKQ